MSDTVNKVSDAELEILKVLWANKTSMSDKQIRDALGGESDWSRTTIQTLIKRLLDKGVLLRDKQDVFYYSPAVTAEELAKARTMDLVNTVFGGNAKSLVSTMLNNDILSDDDMDDLKRYWRERRK